MTETQKKKFYYEWESQMTFLSSLIGEKFKRLLKDDGTPEDDIEKLWDFKQNYNLRLGQELQALREELRNA